VRVLAAFDPYRSGLREEAEYARAKLEAGADGFFTQPFFDLRLAEICRDLLGPAEVWLGVSPVLTPAQRRYWEIKNRAFFPARFEPSLEWNRAFAKDCLALARSTGANLYLMPIRVDVVSYLDGVL
jgi:methylenetetrahydrofolate reductase (NADPH)